MNEEMLMQLLAMLEQGQIGTGAGDSEIEDLLKEAEGGRQNGANVSRGRNRQQSGSEMSEEELMQMMRMLEQGR